MQTSLHRLRHDPLTFLRGLSSECEPSVFHLGRQRVYYLSEPELIGQVAAAQDRLLSKTGMVKRWWLRHPYLPEQENIAAMRSEQINFRRILQPAFRKQAVHAEAGAMEEIIHTYISRQQGEWLDLQTLGDALQSAAVIRNLFGITLPYEKSVLLARLGRYEQALSLKATFNSPLYRLPMAVKAISAMGGLCRSAREGDETAEQIVEVGHGQGRHLASTLPAIAARDMALEMASAAEAARAPLFHLWLALADGAFADALAEEARSRDVLSQTEEYAERSLAQIASLESLRLGAPWQISRYVLDDFETAGTLFLRGDSLFVSPYLLHRDHRSWPVPGACSAENWSEQATAARPRFADLTFGFGSHRCPGDDLAITLLHLVAAIVSSHFRISLSSEPSEVRWRAMPEGALVLPCRPLFARFDRR